MAKHRRAWRVTEYFGMESGKSKPEFGSDQWWLLIFRAWVLGTVIGVMAGLLGLLR